MPNTPPLSLISATSLVVASSIGSGVFTTSGILLAELGSPNLVLVSWLIGGMLAGCGAVCYGALIRCFPESGGEYIFLSRTLHPAAGYLAGWVSLLVGFSAPLAAVAIAFGHYLQGPFPSPALSGSLLLILFGGVHALHVQQGAWVQNVAVAVKLVLITVFLAWAIARFSAVNLSHAPGASSLTGFGLSLVLVSFSYSGWNAAVYIAGEVRNPERNVARAMLLGTAIVTVAYLGLNAIFVYAAPTAELQSKLEIGRIAAQALGGPKLAGLVTGLVALALATSVSSMMMAGPRVFGRMANDGFLPKWFRLPAQGPPRRAILLQTVLALGMLWTATFKGLLTYIGFTLGLCTAGAVIGLIRLRLRHGPKIHVSGWPFVPAIFTLATLGITLSTIIRQPLPSAIGFATVLLGLVVWYLTPGKKRTTELG
jgi:APA family basic amino acid/polyamine antiporter